MGMPNKTMCLAEWGLVFSTVKAAGTENNHCCDSVFSKESFWGVDRSPGRAPAQLHF